MKSYVVVDLEMCKVSRGMRSLYNRAYETIQIGAVMLDENYDVIDSFNTYVSPEYGKLDGFITGLTGIRRSHLEGAPCMEDALKQFSFWMPSEGEVEIVSWSENDFFQISGEMKAKGIENEKMAELMQNWTDCQKIYSKKIDNNRCFALEEALYACDIEMTGQMHDGLSDAYNTAKLFGKMMREPKLILNSLYQNAKNDETEHLSFSMAELFSGISFA